MKKVLLCSIDGLRPDGFLQCGSEHIQDILNMSAHSLQAQTVFPSVTLPCHMSMFHGVEPNRHGILSNDYVPQVHYIKGLFEKISDMGGINAFFLGWEPLRDISRPGNIQYSVYANAYAMESTDTYLTEEARKRIRESKPDFVFLYQVETDDKGGHDNGWMTEEYLRRAKIAVDNVYSLIQEFGDEYTVIITADHGGHERDHGSEMPEDMTIPMFYIGENFLPGSELTDAGILDIPKTVADVMGFAPERQWEGKSQKQK